MIVNPQLFNYRLIIGSLIITMAVLAVFGFTQYDAIQSHQQFLEQEKKLVEHELSQMIKGYDKAASLNDQYYYEVLEAKKMTKQVLDSLHVIKNDFSLLNSVKSQLRNIKLRNESLFKNVDSINEINDQLNHTNLLASNELKKQRELNAFLSDQNTLLNKTIEKGALLTANSFEATAYVTKLGRKTETSLAQKAEVLEICFTLAENALTNSGEKELYVQIVNPKNNVVADKGVIEFGNTSLIYSIKSKVDYHNKVVDVCLNVIAQPEDKPLIKGTYFVSVFHKDRKLGSTQLMLD